MIKDILVNLVKFETVYGNEKAFLDCFNYLKAYFQDSNLFIKEFLFNGFKSMVIGNADIKDFDIVFVGHLDVVSGNKEQFTPFFKDNRLYGRGAFDMKGHVAVMISIMKNLSLFNTPYKVGLFLTSDEERGGFFGVDKLLNEVKYKTKVAIVPDAGNNFSLIKEEKGVLQLKLSYNGKSAHSSQPYNGDNALIQLINAYDGLLKKYPMPKNSNCFTSSINLSSLNGGMAINKVCNYGEMVLDIRHIPKDRKQDFINTIQKTNSKIEIEVLNEGSEFIYLENNLSRKYLLSCEKILKHKVRKAKCESSSDGRFFYQKGVSCVLMNAKGKNLHADNEYINLDSLETLYEIYRDFLKD